MVLGDAIINFKHLLCCSGFSNGGFLEDGTLTSDRRAGRRSRRQKGSAKYNEEKCPPVTSGAENIEVGEVRPLDDSLGQ